MERGCPFDEPIYNPDMPDHIHVLLPSGGLANVSPNCPEETIEALDRLCQIIKKYNKGIPNAETEL